MENIKRILDLDIVDTEKAKLIQDYLNTLYPTVIISTPYIYTPVNVTPDACLGCPSYGKNTTCWCTIPYMNGQGPTWSVGDSTITNTKKDE